METVFPGLNCMVELSLQFTLRPQFTGMEQPTELMFFPESGEAVRVLMLRRGQVEQEDVAISTSSVFWTSPRRHPHHS